MYHLPKSAHAFFVGTLFVLTLFVPLTTSSIVGDGRLGDADADASWPDYMRYIHVNDFVFDPVEDNLDVPRSLSYYPATDGDSPYHIVQFVRPVTPAMKMSLEMEGAVILGYVSYNGFVVRVDSAGIETIKGLPHVRWTGAFEPAYKLSPRLSDRFEEMLLQAQEREQQTLLGTGATTSLLEGSSEKDVAFGDIEAETSALSKTLDGKDASTAEDIYDLSYASSELLDIKHSRPGKLDAKVEDKGDPAPDTYLSIEVLAFEKTRIAEIADAVKRLGGEDIIYSFKDSGVVRATIGKEDITALARVPGVMWIDRYVQPTFFNDIARWVLQSGDAVDYRTPVHANGIWGTGQVVTVCDTGIDYGHDAFEDPAHSSPGPDHRKVTNYYVPAGAFGDLTDNDRNHGTHVSGTVAGDDGVWHVYDGDYAGTNGTDGPHDGQAFDAKIQLQDLSIDGYYAYPPDDYHGLYQPAMDNGSWIHTNSWGSSFGDYNTHVAQTDDFLWNNQEFLVLFAAGNSGTTTGVVSPYASAKNTIGVGATLNGEMMGSVASFSSRGPAADGRIKPDVMAPGSSIWSAEGLDPSGEGNYYKQASGTSMATPNAAGSVALIRQYYMDGFYPTGERRPADAFTPSAALVKATLINSAVEMTGTGAYENGESYYPNNSQGWGRILLDEALSFAGDERGLYLDDNREGLLTDESMVYHLAIGDPTIPLEITLVWTDYPGAVYSSPALVNNLDLVVTAPDGTVFLGNVYAGRDPGESVPNPAESADMINNVESVFVMTDVQVGLWTVEVQGFNVPMGPQPYAAVMTGGLATQRGAIGLDQERYQSNANVAITVIDTDLNTDPFGADTTTAEITSSTETTPETVLLTETGPTTNVFQGSISLENRASPHVGDGVLQVQNGDNITGAYFDSDDGLGGSGWVYCSAVVDDDPPVISGVSAMNVRFNRATIVWETDERSDSLVLYGDGFPLEHSEYDSAMATEHSFHVFGLSETTIYYFAVQSVDKAGNIAFDDNASSYYTFETPERPPAAQPNDEWPTLQNNLARLGASPVTFDPPLSPEWSDGPFLVQRWNSPVVGEGVLVSCTLDGYIRARDPYEGTVFWERKLGGSYYYTGTPAIEDEVVYAAFYGETGGRLYALDLMTGATLWVTGPESGLDINARVALAVSNGVVFGTDWNGKVFALDCSDGSIRWEYQIWSRLYGGPAVDRGIVYSGTRDGDVIALDEVSGQLIWRTTLDGIITSSPLVAQDSLFIGTYNGTMYALDQFDGSIIWASKGHATIDVSTPAYDGSAIYFGSFSSEYVALDAATGSALWSTPLPGSVGSSLAYADGYLYGTCWDGYLRVLDATDGSIEQTLLLNGSGSTSSTAVYDGWVFTEDNTGTIQGFSGLIPVSLSVSPTRQSKETVPSTDVHYYLNVTNRGMLGADTFDATVVPGVLTWGTLLLMSDGVTPLPDTDTDGTPDTGPLAPGASATIVLRVSVPALVNPGDAETILVTFTSSSDTSVHKNAITVTEVPAQGVEIGPRAYFEVLPGTSVTTILNVTNTGGFPDTIDLACISDGGWGTALLEPDGVTPLPDSDMDGSPDTGLMPGLSSREISVRISVPPTIEVGDFDRVIVLGSSSSDPLANGSGTIVLEYPYPPNDEWPTLHNDNLRRGVCGDMIVPPLELIWSGTPHTASMMSSPILSDGMLFTTTLDGAIRASNPFTGESIWTHILGDEYYYTGPPTVASGVVYTVFGSESGGALFALDELTGETIWSLDASSGLDFNARIAPTHDDGVLYGTAWTGEIWAIDASNGSILWTYQTNDLPWGGIAVAAGTVFGGVVYAYEALALDSETGALLWSQTLDDSFVSPPVISQGSVFACSWSGTLYSLDMVTGDIAWSSPGFGDFFLSAPAYAEGALYVGSQGLAFYAVDPADGSVIWETAVDGEVICSPAYANGYLYGTSTDGNLYVLETATGAIVQQLPIMPYMTSSPAVSGGWVWVEDYDGVIHAFRGRVPVGLTVQPAFQSEDAVPGTEVDFELNVTNTGFSGPDTFDVTLVQGSHAWTVQLFEEDGVTPLGDSDGDLVPDTGELDTDESATVVVRMAVPPGAMPGDEETALITLTSSNEVDVSKQARVKVLVPPPDVDIGPGGYFAKDPGETVSTVLWVKNLGAVPDTIDIVAGSRQGWPFAFFEADGVTPLSDTDGDSKPDTGIIPGLGSTSIVFELYIPIDATLGTVDRITVTGISSLDPGKNDSALMVVELAPPPNEDWPTFQNSVSRTGMSPSSIEPPLTLEWTVDYQLYGSGPVFADGMVFAASVEGHASAFDASTGQLVWQKPLGWSYYHEPVTPTVAEGVAYFVMYSGNMVVFALDEATGETLWSTAVWPDHTVSPDIHIAVHDGMVFGASYDGWIYALDAGTGDLVWDCYTGDYHRYGVAVSGGRVLLGGGYGDVYSIDEYTGELVWTTNLNATIASTPMCAQGLAFVATRDGVVYSLDAHTGGVLWQSLPLGNMWMTIPAYGGSMIFIGTNSGTCHALDTMDGTVLWTTPGDGWTITSLAFAGGYLYVGDMGGNLRIMDATDGSVDFAVRPSSTMLSTIAISNDWVWMGDYHSDLYGFRGLVPVGLDIDPRIQKKTVLPGTEVTYSVNVTNTGTLGPDTFDAELSLGSLGWAAALFESDGVTPLGDSDSDGLPDTGELPTGGRAEIMIRVVVPHDAAGGASESTSVVFTSSTDTNVSSTAVLRSEVPMPAVYIGPSAYFALDPGDSAFATMTVRNLGPRPDTYDIYTDSENSWAVLLFAADKVTPLPDTDSDGVPDTGVVPAQSYAEITVMVGVPEDPGDVLNDRTTVMAVSSDDLSVLDECAVVIELGIEVSQDWPTFHQNAMRTGATAAPHFLPLTQEWQYPIPSGVYPAWYGPAISGDTVYLADNNGTITALDLTTGALKWDLELGWVWRDSSSPTVAYGMVYVAFVTENDYNDTVITLYALDPDSGGQIWEYSVDSYSFSYPDTSIAAGAGMVFWYDWAGGHLFANDAFTGELQWTFDMFGDGWGCVGPTYWGGLVVVTDDVGNIVALNATDGAVQWWFTSTPGFTCAATVYEGVVYACDYDATMYALDAWTGDLLWSRYELGGNAGWTAPAVVNDRVYIGASSGIGTDGIMYALDTETGDTVWVQDITYGPVYSAPAYASGVVYVAADHGYVYAFDSETGEPLGSWMTTAGGIMTSVAIGGGFLVVGDDLTGWFGYRFENAGIPVRLEVVPDEASLVVGSTTTFAATAYDNADELVPGVEFQWASVKGLGTVAPYGDWDSQASYVAGTFAGEDVLRVSCSDLVVDVPVSVLPGSLEGVRISPSTASVVVGTTKTFSAYGHDAYGNKIPGLAFAWSSSSELGSISQSGVLTASTHVAEGTVTATHGSLTAEAQVELVPGPIVSFTVTPSSLALRVRTNETLTVDGVDGYGNEVTQAEIEWSCTIGTVVPAADGMSAVFDAGEEAGTGSINVTSAGMTVTVDVQIDDEPRTLFEMLTSGPGIALMILAAAVIIVLLVLLERRRRTGKKPEEVPGPAEPPPAT